MSVTKACEIAKFALVNESEIVSQTNTDIKVRSYSAILEINIVCFEIYVAE